MDHVNEVLGQAVEDALTESGLSIREAAKQTGIPFATLHRKMCGKGKFTVIELLSLANATDRTLRSLIPEELLA
ncbi:helix-turn-helix domain-containing protein [Nocardia sp. NPDC059239]|uniref:helix-turn-helix domain-containing protein n=1 Tax=unclassified Nocardia TaxID=2637762 RepID=UPI0036C0C882